MTRDPPSPAAAPGLRGAGRPPGGGSCAANNGRSTAAGGGAGWRERAGAGGQTGARGRGGAGGGARRGPGRARRERRAAGGGGGREPRWEPAAAAAERGQFSGALANVEPSAGRPQPAGKSRCERRRQARLPPAGSEAERREGAGRAVPSRPRSRATLGCPGGGERAGGGRVPRRPHRCPEGRGGAGAPGARGQGAGRREGGRPPGAFPAGASGPRSAAVAISVEWASGEDVTRRNGEGRWGRGDKI